MKNLTFLLLAIGTPLFAQFDIQSAQLSMDALDAQLHINHDQEDQLVEQKIGEIPRPQCKPVFACCLIFSEQLDLVNLDILYDKSHSIEKGSGKISGKIVDKEMGDVLLFANVALFQNDILITGTETDLDGNFQFTNLEPGLYDIEASYVGYQSQRLVGVEIKETDPSKFQLKLIDAETKETLIGTCVQVFKDDQFVKGYYSDIEGMVYFEDALTGDYQLKLSYVGYETKDTWVSFEKSYDEVIEMKLANNVLTDVVIIAYPPKITTCGWGCGAYVTATENCCNLRDVEESTREEYDQEIEIDFSIYPNPATDIVNIQVAENSNAIFLTTALGQIITKIDNPAAGPLQMSLVNLPSGNYFLGLVTDGHVKTEKLIVAK